MTPKGKILLIGGHEDKGSSESTETEHENKQSRHFEILSKFISAPHKRIEIITTASSEPEEVAKTYKKAFHKLNEHNIDFIYTKDKYETRKKEYLERLEKAHTVFFAGGDQFKLATILGGTDMIQLIKEKYYKEEDFMVAGTSAGAMAIPSVVLDESETSEAMLAGHLHTSAGFGFTNCCIVDTHFIKRGRFGRLSQAVVVNPELLGLGLGEDAALLIKDGTEVECIGSGMVIIINGKEIGQTNVVDQKESCPIFVENLKVDILVKGCRFSLKDQKLYNPAIAPEDDKDDKK